ncbi:hypothetical protein K501DRAFT_212854 [Backusella circina FSU 941]|nr:hypothetical protein K501DRAFT_212854 [Backusella circina FSU 941]
MSSQPEYLYVYGDSYSDSKIETRRTNGPLWSEQLAEAWGTTLVSNAEHGARFCQNKTFKNSKSWLKKQIESSPSRDENEGKSVHVVFLGVTELIETKGSAQDIEDWVECLKEEVTYLSTHKPNAHIVVMGVPPIEFSPYAVSNTLQGLKEKAMGLNVAIEEAVLDWQQALSTRVEFFDTYLVFTDLLGDLSNSKIKDVENAYWDKCQGLCKDDVDSYLWWDTIHMTGSGHKAISDAIQAKELFDIKTTSAASSETGLEPIGLSPQYMRCLSWFVLGCAIVVMMYMSRHNRIIVSLRKKFRANLGKIYPSSSSHQNHEYTLV